MMNWENDFMSMLSAACSEMRLLVEGAVNLFEGDASILCRMACDAGQQSALLALDDIGAALYSMRGIICQVEEECRNEVLRQHDEQA